ncbi:response regulator transcription factor [Nigerium sp.]|uniref:response regulator transcription factor n=1 Tax=Nigerium sp. TaxID=2042655 RepID=UPI0032215995
MTGAAERIRVLLVDDDAMVLQALADYLSVGDDLECIGTCENGREACALLETRDADVVVMDVQMPVLDGVAATRAIKADHPETQVLMLTSFDEDAAVQAALRAGAVGFLLKSTRPAALREAVRAAHRGLRVLSGAPLSRWVEQTRGNAASPALALEPREREVLDALCQGDSNADIAARLHLSESSVKASVHELMRRLGASSRLQIVVRAHALGLD